MKIDPFLHYQVVFKKLKDGVKGCTIENLDGSYTIFIDPALPYYVLRETLKHEIKHIIKGDFGCNKKASNIEFATRFFV